MCKKCPDNQDVFLNNYNSDNSPNIKKQKKGWEIKRSIVKKEKIDIKKFIKPYFIVVINYVNI